MAATMKSAVENSVRARPSVLIVDDEPALLELVRDVLDASVDCRLISASSLT